MVTTGDKNVKYLVVDTTAFIQNAQLQDVGEHIVTCQEVVDEIINKRQLRRLVVLPYDLDIKNVEPENIQIVIDFARKTGDYPSLSATDIKVMALTYQLEKEHAGTEHLRKEPVMQRTVKVLTSKPKFDVNADITGFYIPTKHKEQTNSTDNDVTEQLENDDSDSEEKETETEEAIDKTQEIQENEAQTKSHPSLEKPDEDLSEKFKTLDCTEQCLQPEQNVEEVLVSIEDSTDSSDTFSSDEGDSSDDEDSWITPSNVQNAKKLMNSELMEEKSAKVACMTTDFAMQNVLKQINLNVAALDGRMIKQLRTFILRCYTCFGTTSIMTKLFCPKCGNKTLKRVAVSLDENGKQQIHINSRRPLTARGKKFSLPKIRGGKHSNNPHLVADQPMPDQRPTRLARTKTNALDDDYIAGYSPFAMRDVTSKSAQLKIRPPSEVKHWMKKNPNEAGRRRKK